MKKTLPNYYKNRSNSKWYVVAFGMVVFLLACFFRLTEYFDRIYIYADNSLFSQLGYVAWHTRDIPLVGPFAQAPFFTGPWWLWFLGLLYIFPLGALTPWFMMTFFSLGFIVLLYFTAKEIAGWKFGLVAALFGAVSQAQIDNSFMTWNAAVDPYIGLGAIWCMLKFAKTRRSIFAFFSAFIVSLGTVIHFQNFYIAGVLFVSLFIVRPKIKNWLAMIVGFSIPLLPFIYFDLNHYWFETRRIIDYVLIAQHRIYVPNRWLTYLRDFWPQSWAWIMGGDIWTGRVMMIGVGILGTLALLKFKKNKYIIFIGISFFISVVMLRYYKGERQFYYTNFAHAFVILLTSWAIYQLLRFQKIVGLIIFALAFYFGLTGANANIRPRVITYAQIQSVKKEIYDNFPGQKIAIFECPFVSSLASTPLAYLMYYENRNAKDGVKIGVCNENFSTSWKQITTFDIEKEYGWGDKNVDSVYRSVTKWYIDNPPTSELYP